jgi:hypothetical protein
MARATSLVDQTRSKVTYRGMAMISVLSSFGPKPKFKLRQHRTWPGVRARLGAEWLQLDGTGETRIDSGSYAHTIVGFARRTATPSGTPLASASMTRSQHATPVNAGQDALIACADGSITLL